MIFYKIYTPANSSRSDKIVCPFHPLSSSLCLLSTALYLLFFPSLAIAEEKPVGRIIAIIGTVEYSTVANAELEIKGSKLQPVFSSTWKKAVFQQKVFGKDQFRTLHGSRLKIAFEDNSLIALGPNSTMKVEYYIYKPKQKLRQGLISVAHGLAMYIVNKNQKNKNSHFKIVAPTGNLAAAGTQGYISVSPNSMFVANQAGSVVVSNSDPNVPGEQVVGTMMKTIIEKGKPPLLSVPVTKNEINQIRNVLIGRIGVSVGAGQGEKPLIEVKEEEVEKEEEEEITKEEGTVAEDSDSPVLKESESQDIEEGGEETEATVQVTEGPITVDFLEVNDPFDSNILTACNP